MARSSAFACARSRAVSAPRRARCTATAANISGSGEADHVAQGELAPVRALHDHAPERRSLQGHKHGSVQPREDECSLRREHDERQGTEVAREERRHRERRAGHGAEHAVPSEARARVRRGRAAEDETRPRRRRRRHPMPARPPSSPGDDRERTGTSIAARLRRRPAGSPRSAGRARCASPPL